MLRPPSTARICPVTNGASAAKNSTVRAISAGEPGRCSAVCSRMRCLRCRVDTVLGPEYRAGRDAVDAHLGRQFACQRPRQHDEPGFGDAVDGVIAQRPHAVDVDDVDERAAAGAQRRRRSLRQEQRRLQVGADQVLPLRRCQGAERGRIKRRGIVDQKVQATEALAGARYQSGQGAEVAQIRAQHAGAAVPGLIQFDCQPLRILHRAMAVDRDIGTRGVQSAHNPRADAAGATGDQRGLSGKLAFLVHACSLR